jgi:hypothetical protein
MMKLEVVCAMAIWCCAPVVHGVESQESPREAAGRSRQVMTNPAGLRLLTLGHRWARGPMTVVEVRQQGPGYVVGSRRSFCSNETETEVRDVNAPEVERILREMDPETLPEADPCKRSVRDGTVWVVARDINGTTITRTRQFGAEGPQACVEFARAANMLMSLAGLACDGTACLRSGEGSSATLCP